MGNKEDGIINKYLIQKITPEGPVPAPKGDYFVLRMDGDQQDKEHAHACRVAILMYAACIASSRPKLAEELRIKYYERKE